MRCRKQQVVPYPAKKSRNINHLFFRDQFAYTAGSSQVFTMRFNVIHFGALSGADLDGYNQQVS